MATLSRMDGRPPEGSLPQPNRRLALAARIAGYLRPFRGRAVLALGASLLEAGLGVVPLVALKRLVDELGSPDPAFADTVLPVAVAVAAALAAALVGVLTTFLVQAIAQGVVAGIRADVFARLIGHGGGWFTRSRGGDVLSRILSDVQAIGTTLSTSALTTARAALTACFTLAVIVVLDWRLALLCVAVLPIALYPALQAGRRIGRARREVQEQMASMTTYLHETLGLSGMLLVRAFGRQAGERARFGELSAELRRREVAAAMTAKWFNAALSALALAAPAIVLLAGGYLVAERGASLGTVLVVATLGMARLGASLFSLASGGATLIGSVEIWRRVFDTIDTPPEIAESAGARPLRDVRGELRFEGVSFSYPGQSRPAVADVSFALEPGQTVALVGPSGAGKTTLFGLTARLLDPQEGRVLIDGQDLRDVTLASISEAVGVVFQDSFLFHASIGENLRYGRPDATDDELAAAVDDANLTAVIESLPEGLETIVGERGHRLSGGEKQRVALARTILKDPRILVLDEATSHLDSASERLVQEGLRRLMRGRTSLVIAHRLSTVIGADLILVLDQGRIVERGTHAELIERDGVYAELHDLQIATP